ncbi:MAG: phospho-N-acetylmuramoyl-pentapeptide-transferase, partial [Planctomycetes bacterium]|nr:phospho-N-acetylmuramoyl-pentapeptide-transferase [Planctomycetota bacterium]
MGLAALTAFLFSVVFGTWFIRKLVAWKAGEDTSKTDSEELKRMHSGKKNTPTMGGGIFIVAILVSALLWCQVLNLYVMLLMFTVIWFAALGFADDYIKLTKKNAHGLTERSKFLAQVAFGFIVGLVLYFYVYKQPGGTQVVIPFLKYYRPDVGIGYIPIVVSCMVVMTNAVNLTDGLDGLAI